MTNCRAGVRFPGLIHPGLIGTAPSHELLKIWNDRERKLVEDGEKAITLGGVLHTRPLGMSQTTHPVLMSCEFCFGSQAKLYADTIVLSQHALIERDVPGSLALSTSAPALRLRHVQSQWLRTSAAQQLAPLYLHMVCTSVLTRESVCKYHCIRRTLQPALILDTQAKYIMSCQAVLSQ